MYEDVTQIIDLRSLTRPVALYTLPTKRDSSHAQHLCAAFEAGLYRLSESVPLHELGEAPWAPEHFQEGTLFIIRHRQIDGVFFPHLAPLDGGPLLSIQKLGDVFLVLSRALQKLGERDALVVMIKRLHIRPEDLIQALLEEGHTTTMLDRLIKRSLTIRDFRLSEPTRPDRAA